MLARDIQRRLNAVQPNPAAERLVAAAQRAPTVSQRLVWLRRAATAWASPMLSVAARKRGCAHCCHIVVAVTEVEARLVAKATGRPMVIPQRARTTEELLEAHQIMLPGAPARAGHSACPFLRDSQCSIYEHRPLACRVHLNLDLDEKRCLP